MTPKRQMREKHVLGGHLLTPKCFSESWCVTLSIRLAYEGAREKKAGKQDGRKSQEVYISVCVERPLAGGFQLNLANHYIRLTDVIERAKFHCYHLQCGSAGVTKMPSCNTSVTPE